MEGLFNVTLNLLCKDMLGTPSVLTTVIDQNFSVRFRPGIDSIPDKKTELQNTMQKYINNYKIEQQYFNHPQLDTVVANIQANLIG